MSNLKLNLGCGDETYEDYINIDKSDLPGVDLIWDLEETPLPFESNSVDKIKAEHILEHIVNYMPLLEDIYRVAKPNAKFNILAPYYKYEGSYRDPTHVRFFTEHSFDYFQKDVKFSHYSKTRFNVLNVEKRVRFLSDVKNKQKKIMAHTPDFIRPLLDMFLWNIYSEVRYDLEVVK